MTKKSPDQPGRHPAKRVALYARVSTLDKGQDLETQLRPLREYANRRGFQLVSEYVDTASGTTEDLAQYRAMIGAARKRQFDMVLVWRYDGTGHPALRPFDAGTG